MPLDSDPLWYKDAIIYEVHVRAFFDSNDDGMGDFPGLTEKLDYLQDLGVTAIWLLPFCPSPWKDDGYDIADFTDVHPAYGTLKDFQAFLREAHRRGLRVITELVLNHTSDQHEWFQRSRRAPAGGPWRDFYVWSDTPEKYKGARIIFQDFESSNWTWDPVAKAYFWHRFYSHQPDLNFDNPSVRRAMLRVLDFWANLGVDGFRLDAVPYLFEREGTNCENLPETHAFLKEVRAHLDANFQGRMLLSEANMWPEDAVHYMGNGDECHMNFHFPLMPRLFMANRLEDRFPIIDIMRQTPAIPDTAQWALFLRNHDELTLEMVTDEERDYMYRAYADDRKARINLGIRRRLAPLLDDNRRRIELMNALLLSLQGTPVIYYGDEIGMGDNFYLGDRNGVRTPMQWSSDRNAGFSRTNPQKLYLPVNIDLEYHYEARNVEAQQNNPNSLLWWHRRLILLRKQHKAFGRGSLEFLKPDNRKVLAFYRKYEGEVILVVANLSRFVQPVTLNLLEYKGWTPVEMFGGTEFPAIENNHYTLSLGPNSFYWFALELRNAAHATPADVVIPTYQVGAFAEIWNEASRAELARILPKFLVSRQWFLSKDRRIRLATVLDFIPIRQDVSYIAIVRIEYNEGEPEMYGLPFSLAVGDHAKQEFVLAEVRDQSGAKGVIYGALWDKEFCTQLLEAIARRRKFRGARGELIAWRTKAFHAIWGSRHPDLEPHRLKEPRRNSSVAFGGRFILKMFRRLEEGVHPEVELSRFLSEDHRFINMPQLAGGFEYRAAGDDPITVAVLHAFVPNEGHAYALALTNLSRFFEETQVLAEYDALRQEKRHPLALAADATPDGPRRLIGAFLERMETLGKRAAEMHVTLAEDLFDPAFKPEPFNDFYRRALYHSMSSLTDRKMELLRKQPSSAEAERVLSLQSEINAKFQAVDDRKINAMRIREHGDFHLAEILDTGKDFFIIDFEGDPAQHLSERRIKRCAFRDVAQMMASLRHASRAAMRGKVSGVSPGANVESWARVWYQWSAAAFLRGYLRAAADQPFLPTGAADLRILLDAYSLQQALQDLRDGSNADALCGILELMSYP